MEAEKKAKIMIVEDDSFVVDIYRTKLLQENFQVVGAVNGIEALDKLDKEKPDLVLLDIVMPYMDGIEVLKKIRSNDAYKSLPVVLLTNLSQKDEIGKGMELGATDYLIKSHFTPSEVLEKIKVYLTKK